MSTESSASAILNHEYLPMRARILDIAASLDRIERGGSDADDDPRYAELREALKILVGDEEGRAESVQLLFSRPYDQYWREALQIHH